MVIGGQHFSKSFLGYTTYKAGLVSREGLTVAIGMTILPLLFLVTDDLRHGHLGYIAASIFLVALTLIAAPRVARARQKA